MGYLSLYFLRAKLFLKRSAINTFKWLARPTYFKIHFLYFNVMALLGGLIIFMIERNQAFIDCYFTATSMVTNTGLSVLDVSKLRFWSQFIMLLWMIVGGNVFHSIFPVLYRRYAFNKFIYNRSWDKRSALVGSMHTEYQSLGILLVVVPVYWFIVQLVGWIILWICIVTDPVVLEHHTSLNVSSPWSAALVAVSAFSNSGVSPFTDNVVPFQRNVGFLTFTMLLIIAGNTGFPIFLRWILIGLRMARCIKGKTAKSLSVLLANPRQCYTHLFPEVPTRHLLLGLIAFNVFDVILFMWFDWDQPALAPLPPFYKILNGLLMTVATRTAGFNSLDVALIASPVLVLWVALMYINVYPVAVQIRASNTSRRAKFKISKIGTDALSEDDKRPPKKRKAVSQFRKLVVRDAVWLFIVYVIIVAADAKRFQIYAPDTNITLFKLLFELISAFGTVGLSVGYPGLATSFSTVFTPFNKFMMVVIMILGRHRGLPNDVDRAIAVPVPSEDADEDEDQFNSFVVEPLLFREDNEKRHSL